MTQVRAQILKLLRQGALVPSELAKALQVSPSELRAHIDHLRSQGFDIALHPLLGFELGPATERLLAEDIASRMEDCWLKKIETLTSTASTNNLALECGARGDTGPIAFFAETQTAGRGRFGRAWESQAGEGLWMSLLMHPRAPMQVWPRMTSIAALALAETIESATPLQAQIKWPNDVLCEGRKVAGILAETGSHPQTGPFIVLGIGLNVNQPFFPAPLSDTAVSLRMLCNSVLNRADLAAKLLTRFHALVSGIETEFPSMLERVKNRSSLLGEAVTADIGGMRVEGVADHLDPEGGLVLLLRDGSLRTLTAGEVTLRQSR